MPPKTQHQERRRSREAALQVLFAAHYAPVASPLRAGIPAADTESRLARRLRPHYQAHLAYVPALVDELLGDLVDEGLAPGRAEVLRQEAAALLDEALAIAYSIGYVDEVRRALGRLDKHLDDAIREWRVHRRTLTHPQPAPDGSHPEPIKLPELNHRWTAGWTRIRDKASLDIDTLEPTLFTQQLLVLVDTHREALDALIDGALQGWAPERLGVTDRALLRLGAAELVHCDEIPAAATIDEYVELAGEYIDDKAPKFVNGVLDRIRAEHAPAAKARASAKAGGGARTRHA